VIVLRTGKKLRLFDIFLLVCVGYIQTLSLSKAGIISTLLLFLSLPLSNTLPRHYTLLLLGAAIMVSAFALFSFSIVEQLESNERISRTISRLENIGQESDDSAAGRGYDRVLQNPGYLIIGAGEGGYDRFEGSRKGYELHSGLGTLLFSYGVMGFGLFLLLLHAVAARNNPYILVLFGLVILFGVVHQNIRFTHFWVFLGVCEGMRHVTAGYAREKVFPRFRFKDPALSGKV
jgi:hypothetical protein